MRPYETRVLPSSEYFAYTPSANAREYLLHLLMVGRFHYEAGYDLVREFYDSFLIEVILEGSVCIETEGRSFTAYKNDVVLIDCYQRHRYYSDTGWKAIWAHFDGPSARGYYNLISQLNGPVFSMPNVRIILKNLSDLFELFSGGHIVSEAQIALMLTAALTAMAEQTDCEGAGRNSDGIIDSILYRINANIADPPSIREMAETASLSEYYFIRVFRRIVGMTPKQYVIAVRMDRARYLLKTTALSIQAVGRLVGYASESMFCATFKRVQGVTPSEYRKDVSIQSEPGPPGSTPSHW